MYLGRSQKASIVVGGLDGIELVVLSIEECASTKQLLEKFSLPHSIHSSRVVVADDGTKSVLKVWISGREAKRIEKSHIIVDQIQKCTTGNRKLLTSRPTSTAATTKNIVVSTRHLSPELLINVRFMFWRDSASTFRFLHVENP